MSKATSGYVYHSSTAWKRLLQSIPANYTIWTDGATYYAECNVVGGTDYDDPDAKTVIAAAINATTQGKIVFRGELTLAGTSPLISVSSKSNIALCGPAKLTVEDGSIGSVNIIHLPDCINVSVTDLEVDGNAGNVTGDWSGIFFEDSERCSARDNYLHDIDGSRHNLRVVNSKHMKVLGNTIADCLGKGIDVWAYGATGGMNDILVEGNTLTNIGSAADHNPLFAGNGNPADGLAAAYGIVFKNNYVDTSTAAGLRVDGAYQLNAKIVDNTIQGIPSGIPDVSFKPQTASVGTIKGNHLFDEGILVDQAKHDVVVSSNILDEQLGAGGANGIAIGMAASAIITDNIVNSTQIKIYIDHGDVDFAYTHGNVVNGTPMENSGAATIASGTASIVVAHGLLTTPTTIRVTGTHTEVDLLYVDTLTTTQFTIHATDGNTSGDRVVYWDAKYTP